MTKTEIAKLLTVIQAFDRRTVGDGDVAAWHAVAETAGWTATRAYRAVIEWHSHGADKPMIRPAHVTDHIAEVRRELRDRVLPKFPLPDPEDELQWRRDTLNQLLDQWAAGTPLRSLGPGEAA